MGRAPKATSPKLAKTAAAQAIVEHVQNGAEQRSLLDELREEDPSFKALSDPNLIGVVREWVPTGVDVLDYGLFGGGGVPVGCVLTCAGVPGLIKSTLLYYLIGCFQRVPGGSGVLLDVENNLPQARIEGLNVNLDAVVVNEPVSTEDLLKAVERVVDRCIKRNAGPTLIGIDTWGASAPKVELEGGVLPPMTKKAAKAARDAGDEDVEATKGNAGMLAKPKLAAHALRQLSRKLAIGRCTLWVNNQVIANPAPFSAGVDSADGNALRHWARMRLFGAANGRPVMGGAHIIGTDVKLQVKKNKLGAMGKEIELRLLFNKGFDNIWCTLTHAKRLGYVEDLKRDHANVRAAYAGLGWPLPAGFEAAPEAGDE